MPLSTTRAPPSSARTAVGYQPVGMKPSTRLRSWETSMTAAALASEQATNSRLPSGERPSAEGVIPSGWRGVMATLMLSTRFNSPVALTPMAKTLLVFAAATKRRATYGAGLVVGRLHAASAPHHIAGVRAHPHRGQQRAAGGIVVAERAVRPVGHEKALAVGVKQNAVRAAPRLVLADHRARLRIHHLDHVAVQRRRVDQPPVRG